MKQLGGLSSPLKLILCIAVYQVSAIVSPRYTSISRCSNGEVKINTWTVPQILSNSGKAFTLHLAPGRLPCEQPLSASTKHILSTQNKSSDADFLPKGYFRFGLEFYHPSEYCLQRITSNDVTVLTCNKTCSETTPCISSCCPLGQGLNGRSCQSVPENLPKYDSFPFSIPVVNEDGSEIDVQEMQSMTLHYTQAKSFRTVCTTSDGTVLSEMFASGQPPQGIRFQTNGDLSAQDVTFSQGAWVRLKSGNYCVDSWTDPTTLTSTTTVFVCLHNTTHFSPEFNPNMYSQSRLIIMGVTLAICSVFPLLIVLVYVFILRQRNIHGLTVISLSLTMFFMYVFLSVSSLISALEDRNSSKTFRCQVVGILCNYFFLSLFCWLTVSCFDLWWTFRRIQPSVTTKKVKFCGYAVFGWGAPFLFVMCGILLDNYYSCSMTPQESCSLMPPKYGFQNCYLSVQALGIYLYYPAAILLASNILFFILTITKLREYQESTKFATQNLNNRRKILLLCVKLFVVMGIFWIFEVISWVANGNGGIWFVVDIIKNLQVVGVFIIFVCKKHTWNEVQNHVRSFRRSHFVPTVSTELTLQSK